MKQSSHSLDSVGIRFYAVGLITSAGLILPATPGDRPGVRGLIDEHVQLGKVTGAANPGQKAMTVVASLLVGGDHIDDVKRDAQPRDSGGARSALEQAPAFDSKDVSGVVTGLADLQRRAAAAGLSSDGRPRGGAGGGLRRRWLHRPARQATHGRQRSDAKNRRDRPATAASDGGMG